MSEETWDLIHSCPIAEDMLPFMKTNFCKGGVNAFEQMKDIHPIKNYMYQGREGFKGWIGGGGSIL